MTRRMWRPREAAGRLVREAGEHVADAIRTTQTSGARIAGAGFLLGLVLGAGLVWLGVSLAKQGT